MFSITVLLRKISTDVALEAVWVRFLDQESHELLAEGETDADGELSVDLPDGVSVEIRPYLRGYSFPRRLRIDVDSDASYLVEGLHQDENPSSTDANYCRITGSLALANGVLRSETLALTPNDFYGVVGPDVILMEPVYLRADAAGRVDVLLPRGAVFYTQLEGEHRYVRVPDESWCSLADFLSPFVKTATVPDTDLTLSIADGEHVQAVTAVLGRSPLPFDVERTKQAKINEYVLPVVSDLEIVLAGINGDGELVITPLKVGTCTVELTELPGSCQLRRPEPTRDLSTIQITVTP